MGSVTRVSRSDWGGLQSAGLQLFYYNYVMDKKEKQTNN